MSQDQTKVMHQLELRVGDTVEDSGVGKGTITGFSERGFPMVNHVTCARLIRTDGAVFDPYGTYARDANSGF